MSWLVWHLTRLQDDHVAAAFGVPQVWSAAGWAARFGLPADMMGHTAAQVAAAAAATASAGLLTEYHEETYAHTVKLVSEVTDDDLGRVVDTRWTPHLTLDVRLVSCSTTTCSTPARRPTCGALSCGAASRTADSRGAARR